MRTVARKVAIPVEDNSPLSMYLIPCSCGTSFAVADDYDRKGMHLRSFIRCPTCGKRHDPRNRLLRLGYHLEGFWTVDDSESRRK